MRVYRVVSTLVSVALLGGAGYAGYRTHERWMPYVFPTQPDAAQTPEADPHAGHDHGGHADRVKLSAQAQANLALDVDALTPGPYWRSVLIPGAVVDRPGESDRGVASRVAGLVTDIRARPGDTVKAGDPLFTVQLVSESLQSTQADLARVAKEYQFAAAKRDRSASQVKNGTSAEATLIEDENQVKRFATQLQGLRRQLQVFGLSPAQADQAERGEAVTEVTIVTPARARPAGEVASASDRAADALFEVQELKVQLGEQVAAGQTLCLLANHQRLFVEGRAFKSEASALARVAESGAPVAADFADEAASDWPAQGPLAVHHLSNQVDPATRTFAFYLPLDNQSRTFTKDGKAYFLWRYRPGQRVRLRVPVEKLGDAVFVLPAAAVVREGAEAFVFRQNGDFFERKPVRVLSEDRVEVVVANDGSVAAGTFVVRNQAAALNRALKAATAAPGGGHEGHDH